MKDNNKRSRAEEIIRSIRERKTQPTDYMQNLSIRDIVDLKREDEMMFPNSNRTVREILETLSEIDPDQQEQLENSPIWKEAYARGQRDAYRIAESTIHGLTMIRNGC